MRDLLMQAQNTPLVRNVVKAMGVPLPATLKRATASDDGLAGMRCILGGSGPLRDGLAAMLREAGLLVIDDGDADALVMDASHIDAPADLHALYEFFHPRIASLRRNGRVLVVTGVPTGAETVAAWTARRAVEGFVRSLAKELGRKGATANLLYVGHGASTRITEPVKFLLSRRSAYVDGQPLTVSSVAAQGDSSSNRGKIALVTGAARGIGEAVARRLSSDGAHVVCLDVPFDLATLNATAQAVNGTALPIDLRDADAPDKIAAFLVEKFGGVDIVVHNAGVTRDKTLARMSDDHWRMVLDINLLAIMRLDEALFARKALRDHARVVCMSSIGGIAGNPGQTNYAATKAGLVGYVAAQAPRHAAQGITFNAVAPGFIETRMTDAMPTVVREVGRRLNSLSQGGLPSDVAEAVAFLAQPGSFGVTGQVLRVCGQSLMGA